MQEKVKIFTNERTGDMKVGISKAMNLMEKPSSDMFTVKAILRSRNG